MIEGVDGIKLALYQILVNDLSDKYFSEGKNYHKSLAASIIDRDQMGGQLTERNVID